MCESASQSTHVVRAGPHHLCATPLEASPIFYLSSTLQELHGTSQGIRCVCRLASPMHRSIQYQLNDLPSTTLYVLCVQVSITHAPLWFPLARQVSSAVPSSRAVPTSWTVPCPLACRRGSFSRQRGSFPRQRRRRVPM